MTLRITDAAESDIEAAIGWYTERSMEAGLAFASKLRLALEHVEQYPLSGRSIDNEVRRFLVKDFPYLVIYRLLPPDQTPEVFVLLHTSRAPDSWRERG